MEIQHPYDCIFFPGPRGSIGRGAVWCDDKSKCAVCGWNPRVSEKRMEKNTRRKITLITVDKAKGALSCEESVPGGEDSNSAE